MGEFSWVTLATNDSYSLGALVLAHSLKRVGTVHQLVVMVTPGVTKPMREKLATAFDLVSEVNILDSKDERNLLLLQRPELGITFTKLHCWRLTQYKKCVFLDADTLVLQNCDELFDREEFSAAPDVGWPDCFNSGVFVYKPSDETFNSLFAFAVERGSFDGGDQGLLNLYFSDWAHKDISKHLPFIYNMCSTACYSYLPAFKQFGGNVKIVHFIGNSKPWLQYFNSETMQVSCNPGFEHMQSVFEHWWNIFCSNVHSGLQPSMGGLAGAFAQMTLREPRSPGQDAFEDHLRRQGWEAGRIDYLGQDSFDNVWKKICETMAVDPRRLSDAEHYSPVVVRASPRRESSAYNITEEAATAIKPPNPATITESAEDDTLDIPTPAPIKASDFAPAVIRASTPVPESVKISQPSGIVSEIPAVVSSPATISETAAVVSPVATVPELAKIASSCANASEAAVVASSPATVSRIDSATPSATDHEPSQVVTVAATTGIALSPASVCEPAAVASSPATVPESCEFAPSATVSKAAVVETSPSTLSDPAATVPSLAAETQASSPVMISESATVASVIDSAVTSVAPTAVSQAVAAESAPTTISIPAEIATVPVSELVSSVPVEQSDSTPAVVKTDSTPAVVKTDSTPAVKTDSAPEVVKTDSASAVLSETATLADPTSKSTAKKSETDSVPVVESTATPVVECPAAAVLTPSQIPPEPVSAIPVVEQKSEVAKETSKPDTKAIEKPKPASTTEEQQPEKSTSAAETKKEASKSSEKSSEPTPVPPPRKSGKNGGASSKKTTKKK